MTQNMDGWRALPAEQDFYDYQELRDKWEKVGPLCVLCHGPRPRYGPAWPDGVTSGRCAPGAVWHLPWCVTCAEDLDEAARRCGCNDMGGIPHERVGCGARFTIFEVLDTETRTFIGLCRECSDLWAKAYFDWHRDEAMQDVIQQQRDIMDMEVLAAMDRERVGGRFILGWPFYASWMGTHKKKYRTGAESDEAEDGK